VKDLKLSILSIDMDDKRENEKKENPFEIKIETLKLYFKGMCRQRVSFVSNETKNE